MVKTEILKDLKLPLAVLILAAALLAAFLYLPEGTVLPISEGGFERVGVRVGGQNVYLSSDCRALSMVVSRSQALSIGRALSDQASARPGTHDLLEDALDGYGVEVVEVKIHSLEEGIYHADLYLRKGKRIMKLDSRPSDAIAVALRADATIYVREGLLNKYGRKVC